eukprot:CAMPEP_0178446760 /NCGR_PEP_ID=MMETSP0689_2-20121128/40998_1 /TAXON_ID=160604 /ORGANISM="Amphidinium massartii, Strain CS-259" /LENGTH=506 /DNA_ID=CAMNT_0020071651 /DNA_START=15 /DNA_END=1531 /DNA_ORIENTATION=-
MSTSEWPDFHLVEATVERGEFGGANDVWSSLRQTLTRMSVEDLSSEVGKAKTVWQFLVGLALKKPMFRAQIKASAAKLMAIPSWAAVFQSDKKLLASAAQLPQELQETLGVAPAKEASASAASTSVPAVPSDASQPAAAAPPAVDQVPAAAPAASQAAPSASGEAAPLAAAPPLSFGSTCSAADGPTASSSSTPLLRRCRPFLNRAEDLAESEPIVAHFCRLHAIELLLRARQAGESDSACDDVLFSEFRAAEKAKQLLDLTNGREYMHKFALDEFELTDRMDRAGERDSSIVSKFHLAAMFLEALAQFYDGGVLPPDIMNRVQYAKSRAFFMKDCLQRGMTPVPNPMPACFDDAVASGSASITQAPAEGEASVGPPPTEATPPPPVSPSPLEAPGPGQVASAAPTSAPSPPAPAKQDPEPSLPPTAAANSAASATTSGAPAAFPAATQPSTAEQPRWQARRASQPSLPWKQKLEAQSVAESALSALRNGNLSLARQHIQAAIDLL